MTLHLTPARIEPVSRLLSLPVTVAVLRLDELHPVVSGNKWFKLKFYLEQAQRQRCTALATFGGAYSNHLVATAAAAQRCGLQSVGLVRGEAPPVLSHTLLEAQRCGMSLFFLSRTSYGQKRLPDEVSQAVANGKALLIPEGGYGPEGVQGAEDILRQHNTNEYTHIVTAVGTGTTLAGLVAATAPHQQVIGIPVLKNAGSLRTEINRLLPVEKQDAFVLQHDYHYGGYAKTSAALFDFMNLLYRQTGVPTDFVYTGKAFFAALDLANKNFFPAESKVLLLHTGGLQGNRSLKKGTLIFD